MEAIERWVKYNLGTDGYGYGYGSGDGYGYGDGYGSDSDCLSTYCGKKVHYIDGIPTVIHSIRGAFAKAGVIQKDFTEKPCYLAKGKGFFAHGETVKEAATALEAKIAENEPIELRIERFVQKYPTIDSVAENKELFIWHHILTGSCEFGRREFAKKHDIDVEHGRMTVCRFIELTEEEYCGRIIALLKQKYEKSN